MKVLFIYSEVIFPNNGGVQRITFELGRYLNSNGFQIFFLSIKNCENFRYPAFQYLTFPPNSNFEQRRDYLTKLITDLEIDYIINQDINNRDLVLLCLSVRTIGVKLISVIHNSILGTAKNFVELHENKIKSLGLGFTMPILRLKITTWILEKLHKIKNSKRYRGLINKSDVVVLLSEKYISELKKVSGLKELPNIKVIPNFIPNFNLHNLDVIKKNKILFVGRIDFKYKRIDLLLEIWKRIQYKAPLWSLDIVCTEKNVDVLERMIVNYGLERLNVITNETPDLYYQNASLLAFTSSLESFGIVLIEAMHFGVVPIAFNSYPVLTEIISNRNDGIVIENFSIEDYCIELLKLMVNPEMVALLSQNAKVKSELYSVNRIGPLWIELLKKPL